MSPLKKYPFYIRATVILLGLIVCCYILFALRDILIPLSFALFLAILLNPMSSLLQRWRLPKIVSIALSLIIAIIVFGGVGYFLFTQMMHFTDQAPVLQKKSTELVSRLQQFLSDRAGLPLARQDQYIQEAKAGIEPLIGQTLGTVVGTMATIVLLPVYTFLFLYYKTLILDFLYEIFSDDNAREVSTVLRQVRSAIQHYMYGLMLEGLIVAALNSIALLLLGVPYAILLGVLGAILNMLPFIGGILAVLLPLVIETITKDGFHTQLATIISYIVIQFVDNHFLVPYIVSSKVKINALISIVIVLLGGAIWGISGMFLSIPFIGVLKIIFDRVPELQPWGRLLGSDVPVRHRGQLKIRILRKKSSPARHT